MSACGCTSNAPARCPEGKRLSKREAEAVELRMRLMVNGAGDPDYIAARERMQRMRDDLVRHLAGEAALEVDAYQDAERAALAAGA